MNKHLNKICQCDKCGTNFERKWVTPQKALSKINEVNFWTEGKKWNNYQFLCRNCLKEWFLKDKDNFNKLVTPYKRNFFYNYYNLGFFDKNETENITRKTN